MMQTQCLWKKPASCKLRKGQSGIALITVVIVFAILVVVVGVSIVLARTETSTSTNNIRAEQALSLAEAGIDWAAAKIRFNPSFSTTTTYLSISGNPVGVTVTNNQQTKNTTVMAYSMIPPRGTEYPTASRAIRATFLVDPGIIPGGTLFKRAITADGTIGSKNNAEIRVSSNLPMGGSISILSNYASATPPAISFGKLDALDGNAGIMQNATSSGIPSGQVTKTDPEAVPTLTQAEIDAWHAAAEKEGHYFSGDQNWESGITLDGIYFVDGNVIINNKLEGTGTLVVNGNLTTKNKTNWASNSMALIILGSADLDMNNKASITGYIYCGGNIEFKNTFSLVGAMTLKGNLYFKNNGTITYQDLGLGGYFNPPGFSTSNQSLQLQSWQEVAPP